MPRGKPNLRLPKFSSKTKVIFNNEPHIVVRVHLLYRKYFYELETGELSAEDELSIAQKTPVQTK